MEKQHILYDWIFWCNTYEDSTWYGIKKNDISKFFMGGDIIKEVEHFTGKTMKEVVSKALNTYLV